MSGASGSEGTSTVGRLLSSTCSALASGDRSVAIGGANPTSSDGVSAGAVASYTFSNVTANHTIAASFAANTATYTITASAGAGGRW